MPVRSLRLPVLASCQQLFDELSQRILLDSFVYIHLEKSKTYTHPTNISSYSAFINPMLVQNVWIDLMAGDEYDDPITLSPKLMECTSSLYHRTTLHILIHVESRPFYVPILHQTLLQSFRSFTSFRTVRFRTAMFVTPNWIPENDRERAKGNHIAAAHFTYQLRIPSCLNQQLSPALGKATFGRNEFGSPKWIEFHPRRPQELDEPAYSPKRHMFWCPLHMPRGWKPNGSRHPWQQDYKEPDKSHAEMMEAKAKEEMQVDQGLKSIAEILGDMPDSEAGPVWEIVRNRWPARHSDSCMDRLW